MLIKLAICLVVLVNGAVGQISPTENYTHSATLKSGNIEIYWKFNDTYITFEVMGQTTGWIGIGFSPNGAMTGSDIIVGWVKNGKVTVTDRHGTGNTFPPLDPEQNINVLGGTESNGWTMYKFSRQLAACEADYDREITQATQRLIWAYGENDPSGDDIIGGDYHGSTNRGAESMYFLQSPNTPSSLPVGPIYETFDILAEDFEIPAEDTYYSCRLYKIPELTSKKHIVKFEPIVQEGNELNVHHILIYQCGDVLQNETELGLTDRCYTNNMAHFATCTSIFASWAIGGTATYYPEEAGFPIGSEGDPVYIQMETHYDNPTKQAGIIDNSGIRFTYTSTIREYEIGLFQIGAATDGKRHFIPPGASDFLSTSFCTPACIENRLDDAGVNNITIFSVFLHSHLAGRSLRLRHIRNGTELPYIASDPNYDFNYQESRYLDPFVTLEKNDYLQMECIYNTEDRDVVTQGGLGTTQEMCMSFVSYYPKIDLSYCISSVSEYYIYPYLGLEVANLDQIGEDGALLESYNITAPPAAAGMTAYEYLNKYNWTSDAIKAFETYYNNVNHFGVCLQRNQSLSTYVAFDPNTIITTPYVEEQKTCDIEETTSSLASTAQTTTSSVSKVTTIGTEILLAMMFCLAIFN